jgi:hypothetical protein
VSKVAGVIETLRPDAKNPQYQAVLKNGDALVINTIRHGWRS